MAMENNRKVHNNNTFKSKYQINKSLHTIELRKLKNLKNFRKLKSSLSL